MTQRIGAEIFGIDLRCPADDDIAAISRALAVHQVVFFRDQLMDPKTLVELGRRFGDLTIHSGVAGMAELPEVAVLKTYLDGLRTTHD